MKKKKLFSDCVFGESRGLLWWKKGWETGRDAARSSCVWEMGVWLNPLTSIIGRGSYRPRHCS